MTVLSARPDASDHAPPVRRTPSILDGPDERIVVGVDTHKNTHVAVVLNGIGGKLSELSVPANTAGYHHLEAWAAELGTVSAFGVEGTGSYGAGLASHLRRRGHRVLEIHRPNRQSRWQAGKSDTLHAENAARAVLARTATALPSDAAGWPGRRPRAPREPWR